MKKVRHPERQARHLLRNLPEDLGKLKTDSRARSNRFCELYLVHCDDVLFTDSKRGLELAEIAPWIAEHTEPPRLDLQARAHAVLGGAYRIVNDLPSADATYEQAARLAESLAPLDRADVSRRFAILRCAQGRPVEALSLATRAVSAYRAEGTSQDLGWALIVEGMAEVIDNNRASAIASFGAALELLNPATVPRLYYSAIHNLAYVLLERPSLTDLEAGLLLIKRARSLVKPQRQRPNLAKMKLSWLEGIAFVCLGSTRRAEELFVTARHGFMVLRHPIDLGLVSLDLGSLMFLEQRWADLQSLAAETFDVFRRLSADSKALAALQLWHTAVRTQSLTDAIIEEARDVLLKLLA